MGMLVKGKWTTRDSYIKQGSFFRETSKITGAVELEADAGSGVEPRYWLIASKSCAWSHGATIIRAICKLQAHVGLHIAHGPRIEGYAIDGGESWNVPGTTVQIEHVHQIYSLSDEMFTGRSTVPVLWDAGAARIVSNDSRSIIRSFTDLGRRLGNGAVDLAPAALHDRIEATNDWLFAELSNAVYQAGFAESQRAYDVAEAAVFETLDALDNHLAKHRYLLGEVITESDWRLFATLVRFDCVYAVLHRCSRKRLVDYPSLWAYARELYAWPGAAETVDFAEILQGSYLNDTSNNPHNIVPALPRADWQAPSDRGLFKPGLAWPMPDAAGFGPSL